MSERETNPGEWGALATARPRSEGSGRRGHSTPGLGAAWILGAALTTVLLSTSPAALAQEPAESAVNWGDWNLLDNGLIGRRLEPPRMDLPREQRRLATTDSALKEAAPAAPDVDALWLHTDATGLFGVAVVDLAAGLGKSPSVLRGKARRGQLSMTNADQPVPWHYDQAADRILFGGQAYETFYTRENAYRLWLAADEAQPMQVVKGSAPVAPGSEAPFAEALTFEKEPDMYFSQWAVKSEPDADYWFWDYLWGGYKDLIEVTLDLPNPSPFGTAQLRVTLRGWTDLAEGDEHQVYAELNGQPVGPVLIWDGFEERVLVASFDQSTLDPGGSNVLHLRNIYSPGTSPGQYLDQIDVDYARLPVADDGPLWMHDVAAGTQRVSGFGSGDILVIESPAGAGVLREDVRIESNGGDWSVTFESAGGADYLVAERSAWQTPALAPDYPSDLKKRNNRADYLLIAPRDFAGTAEALAAYRSHRYGYVKLVWLDDIYDEFSAGRVDPFALMRFMDHVSQAWRTAPSVVMLIGKGSLDHKNRMGYADSFLPMLHTSTPWALAASDDRLLGGESDTPFAFGRLPIIDDAEGLAYVDKLRCHEDPAFEGCPVPGDERYTALLVADNPDDGGEFHLNTDVLAERLVDALGFDRVDGLYHQSQPMKKVYFSDGTIEVSESSTVREQWTLSDAWSTGYVSYDGHGSTSQVGDFSENFLNTVDAGLLGNASYPIFTALTCQAGRFSWPGTRSLAGALVLNPAGGAIASMAPTGLSLDLDAQRLGTAFLDSLYGENSTIGDAVRDAKAQTQGEVADFMRRIYAVVGEPAVHGR